MSKSIGKRNIEYLPKKKKEEPKKKLESIPDLISEDVQQGEAELESICREKLVMGSLVIQRLERSIKILEQERDVIQEIIDEYSCSVEYVEQAINKMMDAVEDLKGI